MPRIVAYQRLTLVSGLATPKCGVLLATALVLLLGASCAPATPDTRWPDWQNAASSLDDSFEIRESKSTCRTCIGLRQVLLIADTSRLGAVDESQFVTIDSVHRIWAATYNGYKVYDARGQYVRTVGRFGGGPLEFTAAGPIYTDAAGRLHAFDPAVYRELIISNSFELLDTRQLPLGAVEDVVGLSNDGKRALVNAEFIDPQLFASAVHQLDSGKVTRSYATSTNSVSTHRGSALARKIAVERTGHFIIAKKYVYEFDVVSQEGTSLLRARRTKVWPSPPGGVPKPLEPSDELWGVIHDITVDSDGRLWVLSWDPKPNWRDLVSIRTGPDGAADVRQKDDSESLYVTRLEVFDLKNGEILGTQTFQNMIWGFLGPDRAFGFNYAESREPQLAAFQLSLDDAPNK